MLTHKQWLDNEYQQWIKALQESTVHNFKEHPVVKRMLSLDLETYQFDIALIGLTMKQADLIREIDNIGFGKKKPDISNYCLRMVYYAQQILKLNPSSICEIGGGVGQFYAILRALGWKGKYYIQDLLDVHMFQRKYLLEVAKQTGLNTFQEFYEDCEMIVSFYALGEFDDETKESYRELIDSVEHGYIAWNPHSNATDDLSIFKHDIKVKPGIEPGVKIIEW